MTVHDRNPEANFAHLAKPDRELDAIIRRAETEGPQYVSVAGHAPIVVISRADFEHLSATSTLDRPERTGADLIALLRNCPVPDFDFSFDREQAIDRDAPF